MSEISAIGPYQDFSWATLPPEALRENLFHARSSFWHLPALPGLQPPPLISKASIFVSVLPSHHLLCVWIKYPSAPPPPKDGGGGLVAKSYPTLCNPMDCSPPCSSVHGIPQARILEWVAISSSRGSSWPWDWTCISCLAGGFFTPEPLGESLIGYMWFNLEPIQITQDITSPSQGSELNAT